MQFSFRCHGIERSLFLDRRLEVAMASLIGGSLAVASITLEFIGGEITKRCFDAALEATIFRGVASRVQVRTHLNVVSLTCNTFPPTPLACATSPRRLSIGVEIEAAATDGKTRYAHAGGHGCRYRSG